ncbi:serine hydrolase [Geodermatophilus sp. SYSU D01045]
MTVPRPPERARRVVPAPSRTRLRRHLRLPLVVALVVAGVLGIGWAARADHLQDRVAAGSTFAADRGTTIGIALLDRATGQYRDNGGIAHQHFYSASVMKVFIADSLLRRRDLGHIALSGTDLADMSRMLRSSDNAPANRFWVAFGQNGIVTDVAARYGMAETAGTTNLRYWGNVRITAHDTAVYYQRLLDGTGGLSPASTRWLVDELRASTPDGTDGYHQWFGLRDGLPGEAVIGQKQGWMCCVEGQVFRHSTGFVGPDGRYVVVVLTREPSGLGAAHADASITGAVARMFPEGRIPRVQNAIADTWTRLGGAAGALGMPVDDERAVADGRGAFQYFDRGAVYWSGATGAHAVVNGNLAAWIAQGYERGPLGYPVTDELPTADRRGAFNWFEHGAVYWSAATGSHWVVNGIAEAWVRQGYEQGPLGYPVTDELATVDRSGAFTWFQDGAAYWSASSGTHWMTGPVLDAWIRQGYEQGPLGYPVTDPLTTADRQGRFGWFQDGAVYWSASSGAHWLTGPILQAWIAQGYEQGPLGYPLSDPQTVAGGTQVSFQGGTLLLDRATGQVRPVPAVATAAAQPAPAAPAAPSTTAAPTTPAAPTTSSAPTTPATPSAPPAPSATATPTPTATPTGTAGPGAAGSATTGAGSEVPATPSGSGTDAAAGAPAAGSTP